MGEVILSTAKLAAIDIAPGRINGRGGRDGRRDAGGAGPDGRLVSAVADVYRRLRRRHRRHERGRRRDLQVRQRAAMGGGAHGRAGGRDGARARARAPPRASTARSTSTRAAAGSPCRCQRYEMPRVAKRSAGYHAEAGHGSRSICSSDRKGTLGVITRGHVPRRCTPAPNIVLAFVPARTKVRLSRSPGGLRDASMRRLADRRIRWTTPRHRRRGDRAHGSAIAGDRRARTAPIARYNVAIPEPSQMALLVQLELDRDGRRGAGVRGDPGGSRCRQRRTRRWPRSAASWSGAASSRDAEIALPHDARRAGELLAVREAVPAGVNQPDRPGQTDGRPPDREDRGGHDRPLRSLRRR